MNWTVKFRDDEVLAELAGLPPSPRSQVARRIDALQHNPVPPGCKKLQGGPYYRLRSGDYRVVYRIESADRLVIITRVRHRKDVYRGL